MHRVNNCDKVNKLNDHCGGTFEKGAGERGANFIVALISLYVCSQERLDYMDLAESYLL